MTNLADEIEAVARGLCRHHGVDPDSTSYPKDGPPRVMWQTWAEFYAAPAIALIRAFGGEKP